MTSNITGATADKGTNASNHIDDILGREPEIDESENETKEEEKKPEDKKEEPAATELKEEEPEKKVLVPHGAFHEERERRKELQKKLAEQEERSKTLEDRQNKILEALAARNTPVQEQEYIDPLAKIESELQQVKTTIQKSAAQIEEDNKNKEKEAKFFNRYRASVDAYTKDAPDFKEAYNYLIESRAKELSVFIKDQDKLNQRLAMDERSIVEEAFANEQNPGEVIHALAKERGYKMKEPEKKIEDIDKGLKNSKSLGSGGKVSGSEDNLSSLSAEDLRDMSSEEFDALYSKLKKQSKRT